MITNMIKIKEKLITYLKSRTFFKYIFEKGLYTAPDNEDASLVRIDIGCGRRKIDGCIGIDKEALPGVDIVRDIEEQGLPFADNSVDMVYANSVLEHFNEPKNIMSEIYRVLKKDTGRARIFATHFSNPYGYSDFQAKRLWGYFTFDHFVKEYKQKSKRKVPDWYQPFYFEIVRKELFFTSDFVILKFPAKLVQWIINQSDILARLYEYNFCYIYPAWGIRVEMKPDTSEARIMK
ncbi:MAG TPA: methyltransferase domain-containing protein [Candidatus Paceibacterota bacterium]|nr:methyltransferase domain-containing protein [Candidatus Paceibacterota bacterium]